MVEPLTHLFYPSCAPEEADACAWVFASVDKFQKYYYKFTELKENEVRARVLYASLCHSDSMTGRGKWGGCNYPCCAGHEVAAEVIAIGSAVTKVKVGDKVAWGPFRDSCGKCEWCLKGWTHACTGLEGQDRFLYGLYFGGYSTHIQQPESHCFKIPSNLPLEKVAPLMCAGVTTFTPLLLHAQKGQKIGIIGVGGLGHLGAQFASKMGLEVHAFSASEGKEEFFKSLGIRKAVNWRKEDLAKYEGQYDLLLNTIPVGLNKTEMHNLLNCLKPYGKFLNVGLSDIKETLEIGQFSLVGKGLSVIGSMVGGTLQTEETLKFAAEHGVECISEFYEWEDFPKALDNLENGRPYFRGVVNVGNESIKFIKK